MDHLPNEILVNIVECLSPADVVDLSHASKTLRSRLSLTVTAPRHVATKRSASNFCVALPLPDPVRLVAVSLHWNRFGRVRGRGGSRNHRVSVVSAREGRRSSQAASLTERDSGEYRLPIDDDDGGSVVAASEIDLRANRRLAMTFRPEKKKSYRLRFADQEGDSGHAVGVKTQTLAFGRGIFGDDSCSSRIDHFLVKITTQVPSNLLDEAMTMGMVRETDFYDDGRAGEMNLFNMDEVVDADGDIDDDMVFEDFVPSDLLDEAMGMGETNLYNMDEVFDAGEDITDDDMVFEDASPLFSRILG